MLPLKTILHPTDFSPQAEHAFHLGCSLARDHGARLIVLHVAAVPIVSFDGAVTLPSESEWQAVEETLHRLKPADVGLQVDYRLERGDPIAHILRTARETPCDLIVMGTHGRSGLGRLLMGSVAEQIVRKAACPVLTVKTPLPEEPSA